MDHQAVLKQAVLTYGYLRLAWSAERSAQVDSMSSSELKALRQHLVNEEAWPEPVSDARP